MPSIFEWDPAKDLDNRRKHGVAFDEARTVFDDPLGRIVRDPRHYFSEERFALLGVSVRGRLLTVLFVERSEDRIRIISARSATRRERVEYEESYS